MDPEKIGKFIKKIRKSNNLTQNEFAQKYNVTYQAVSKWENGINLPEISLLRQICKDYNVSIENLLDGEEKTKKNNNIVLIGGIVAIILIIVVIAVFIFKNQKPNDSFNFKTLSTTCNEFKVSGSIAYDKDKSSIYISNIDYCGGDDETIYETIECNLYELNNNTSTKISSCKSGNGDIKLEEYLRDVELNIDNYAQTCNAYGDDSLYLEINATDKNNKTTTYKIPLNLNDNCPK